MKRLFIILFALLLSLWILLPKIDGSNGFEEYLVNEFGDLGISVVIHKCSTAYGRSRAGFCSFAIKNDEPEKLKTVLKLRDFVPPEETVGDEAFFVRGDCVDQMHLTHLEKGKFDIDKQTWNAGVLVYVIDAPLQHDKRSNIRPRGHLRFNDQNARVIGKQNVLFYDSNTKEYCIELEYPYG